MVAKHVKADIIMTPSNDPRSYRVNSDRLLATGFRPKKTVEDAIKEIVGMYSQGQLKNEDRWYNLKWMEKDVVKLTTRAFSTPARLFGELFRSSERHACKASIGRRVERLHLIDLLDCLADRAAGVFFAGNGGSGGNANHLANDFLYALSKTPGSGLRVHSLSANPSVITCLANDEGYDQVFSVAARGAGAQG